MKNRMTKIICTIGPATRSPEMIEKLALAGMDVARVNMSHESHPIHLENIQRLKAVREKLNVPLPILIDTKGPEIRIKTFKNGEVELVEGNDFFFTSREIEGDENGVSVTYKDIEEELFVGDRILVNNGLFVFEVTDVNSERVMTKIIEGGKISDRKSMNFPNKVFKFPYLSEQDIKDITFAAHNDVDFIACSFVSKADDLIQVRELLKSCGKENIDLIAKIENRSGVENIDEILEQADGIMVARGDMGVEIPYEELPSIQKTLIMRSRMAGKQVITATEMLESMITNPRPTRAEISDVANAVYDETSALMLSGETAMGENPIETVQAMAKIATKTESMIHYARRFKNQQNNIANTVDAVSHSTCTMSIGVNAKAIVVCTSTGSTAKMVSRFRAPMDILALTTNEKAYRKLALSWGVTPFVMDIVPTTDDLFAEANRLSKKYGFAESGETVVVTAGTPISPSTRTNLIKVEVVK